MNKVRDEAKCPEPVTRVIDAVQAIEHDYSLRLSKAEKGEEKIKALAATTNVLHTAASQLKAYELQILSKLSEAAQTVDAVFRARHQERVRMLEEQRVSDEKEKADITRLIRAKEACDDA